MIYRSIICRPTHREMLMEPCRSSELQEFREAEELLEEGKIKEGRKVRRSLGPEPSVGEKKADTRQEDRSVNLLKKKTRLETCQQKQIQECQGLAIQDPHLGIALTIQMYFSPPAAPYPQSQPSSHLHPLPLSSSWTCPGPCQCLPRAQRP